MENSAQGPSPSIEAEKGEQVDWSTHLEFAVLQDRLVL